MITTDNLDNLQKASDFQIVIRTLKPAGIGSIIFGVIIFFLMGFSCFGILPCISSMNAL